MRSPPSGHGFPHFDNSDMPSSGEYHNLDSRTLNTLPDYVAKDIITTETKDSYIAVRLQREQRLHSLIRRYTNQIQHGCRNRNCAVRTCLSFRKRNTKGPVRPYSDLTARSIAANLVDECFKAGRDPTAGLCPNEPVVPWYKYPDEQQSRHRASRVGHKEQVVKRKTSYAVLNNHDNRSSANLNAHPTEILRRSTSRSASPDEQSEVALPDADATGAAVHEKQAQEQEEQALVQTKVESYTPQPPQCYNQERDSLDTDHEQSHVRPAKKDWASFVQCLWDTATLSLLSKPLSAKPSSSDNKLLLASAHDDAEDRQHRKSQEGKYWNYDDTPEWPRSPHGAYRFLPLTLANVTPTVEDSPESYTPRPMPPSNFGTAFCGLTLRRLTWQTLKWFSAVCSQPSELPSAAFETFVKQSIFYSLSNPLTLHDSARSWSEERKSKRSKSPPVGQSGSDKRENQSHRTSRHPELGDGQNPSLSTSRIPRLDVKRVFAALETIQVIEGSTDILYDSLHSMLQQCYEVVQPNDLKRIQQRERSALRKFKSSGGGFRFPPVAPVQHAPTLSAPIAADVLAVTLLAALAPLFGGELHDAGFEPLVLGTVEHIRNRGHAYPPSTNFATTSDDDQDWEELSLCQLLVSLVDHFEDWHLLRLTYSLTNCLSHHIAAEEIRRAKFPTHKSGRSLIDMMMDSVCRGLPKLTSDGFCPEIGIRAAVGLGIKELVRSILLKEWDREPIIQRTSPVGGALELLAAMYRRTSEFYIQHNLYPMPFIAQAFDTMEMPTKWLSFKPSGQQVHILHYSFLFEAATLVKYFRSINATAMRRSHENASIVAGYTRLFLNDSSIPVYGAREVLDKVRPRMAKYFVLTVRRTSVLEDAINQIWRRHKQEVLQPLKVRLGKDEGEDGLDHGGVQQEFFKLVFAEAFRTEYGMFTVDDTTRMTWFQPGSVEQLYRFEALGILMSLAIYNAVTLPITMPLAFYRKLLGLKVKKLDHIEDGWPDLTKGLRALLDFEDDVAESIARTYEFSYEFAGSMRTVDMLRHGHDDPWPIPDRGSRKGKEKAKSTSFELPVQLDLTPPSASPIPDPLSTLSRTSSLKGVSTPLSMDSEEAEAPLVTNETRERYVKDYIFWLTDKSVRLQYDAFAKGFFTCLDQGALSMFTPEALRDVVEGHRKIDLRELQSTTTYEDYEKDSDYIKDFWDVIMSFSPDQHRKLLEFVTASDRVPVSGLENIQFIVQKNGEDDERLPSSSTCYGRLLLPRYSNKKILEDKLTKALENSMGFGML